MCNAIATVADVTTIVPTPWVPPLVPIEAINRFRRIPQYERIGGVDTYYPRVPGSIEFLTQTFDADLAERAITRLAVQLHAARSFDLIHAHFIYPDGVIASRLGRRLGIPVMTTEHAFWLPWMADQPRVARQVSAALPDIRLVTCVSQFLRSSVDDYLGGRVETEVLPNVIDQAAFFPDAGPRDGNELLFVGLIRKFKRVDVLLRAVAAARATLPDLRLRILSANAFRAYGKDRREVHQLIDSLGLRTAITIVQGADPAAVAEAMRRCAFVAVSSTRRETFCSVAAESLACGTPLVITRCGGPEEFVVAGDGVMVDADDPAAFAAGILTAMHGRDRFDSREISARAIGRFGTAAWRERAMKIYERIASTPARMSAGARSDQ